MPNKYNFKNDTDPAARDHYDTGNGMTEKDKELYEMHLKNGKEEEKELEGITGNIQGTGWEIKQLIEKGKKEKERSIQFTLEENTLFLAREVRDYFQKLVKRKQFDESKYVFDLKNMEYQRGENKMIKILDRIEKNTMNEESPENEKAREQLHYITDKLKSLGYSLKGTTRGGRRVALYNEKEEKNQDDEFDLTPDNTEFEK